MPKDYLDECHCGSGKEADAIYDKRGIFVCYACDKCREERLRPYRKDIFTDPNYEVDEPIEPEDY